MKICGACQQRFESEEWRCPTCHAIPDMSRGYPTFASDNIHGDGSFPPEAYQQLFNAEAGHFWFRSRNHLIIWALRRYFPDAKQFMEIGCGTGFVLSGIHAAFPTLALSAGELLTQGLDFARKRLPYVQLCQMDARHLPFENEFDVIGAFDMLEHIPEDEVVLAEIFRAVKPNGGIILTVPQHPWLWSDFDAFSHHQRRYARADLLKKARTAGFEITFVTSFVTLLLPFLLLSRLRRRKPAEQFDCMAEFRLPRFINRSLEMILSIERGMITSGWRLPIGGSLLVVAKRAMTARMN